MRITVLMGSPLLSGNTATLVKPFIERLKESNVEVDYIELYDKEIKGCVDCRACQKVNDEAGCSINDEMNEIYDSIMMSDCIVLASPIFTWFCTAPMKAVLDRMFAFSKFYDDSSRYQAMLEGKSIAMIATCGDEIDKGMKGFDIAVENLSSYAKVDYIGSYSVRDVDGISDFVTEEAVKGSVSFAEKIICSLNK